MSKVITFIGTSIFKNYLKEKRDNTFKDYLEDLEDKNFNDYSSELNRINYIKRQLTNWINSLTNEDEIINVSAEIKSITKIYEIFKKEIEIHFLTTDTILSNLAFEVIKDNWDKFSQISSLKIYPQEKEGACIKNLQVKNYDKFKEGLVNLINKIDNIVQGYWENVIFNITAGYKALIPYLTILAQVHKCPIYYIFEDTDVLIKIPYIPISINWEVFQKNENFFFDLEVKEIDEIPSGLVLKEEVESLLEKSGNLITLNPLGIILWEKYKSSFYLIKIFKIAEDYMNGKDDRIKQIFEKSVLELFRRLKSNPNDPDLDHKLANVSPPPGFKTFKHKEENLQVRILYKKEDFKTRYGSLDFRIYIGLVAIGQDVHNVENEYVCTFKQQISKITDFDNYKVRRIKKEEVRL
ncbi:MAG: hypothetical protein PWQ78_191 [Petrotoga sp.]|uniref:CRISPR system ring nuclease SSO1393-like domain-containing protein n=1 Tax=Thermodesulfobacterium commune TaxID=1741 RepID=A0A3B8N5D9_9BACT|nr:hypothetical protein [Thermodesulfobacterium thermophilum]MDK2811981.1 hypothetical protein [Petrotoga sp.]HAA83488.1 hypothetical protein [Thermodesulfobacterium commune]HCP10095.1 hypothetical protein [Thermodesulfobacterium commune]